MKLLNFSNVEFKCEDKNKIRCGVFYVSLACKFKYWFYHPVSIYFRNDLDIELDKNCYQNDFIDQFKELKKNITNETT